MRLETSRFSTETSGRAERPAGPAVAAGIVLLGAALGVLVFIITGGPYRKAERRAPKGGEFMGQIALAMDINSYYSFIRQGADGQVLFRNTMTHLEHDPVFFNLEWLALGRCMRWFGWTERQLFDRWRAAGAVMLLAAFALLAVVCLKNSYHRVIALLMCAFGSGFGWVLAVAARFGWVDLSGSFGPENPAMELIIAIHPFAQIAKNPHYSLPHGTFLLLIACLVLAEMGPTCRGGAGRWYFACAVLTLTQGLIRPYDLITIYALLSAYMLFDALRTGKVEMARTVWRLTPLVAALPLLSYYVYIYKLHPVFKYWAVQGDQPPMPIHWHALSLGLAGALLIYRLIRYRRYPLHAAADRLLLVLTAVILGLYYANRFSRDLSFSPQIGIPLLSPMILIGVAALPNPGNTVTNKRKALVWAFAAVFVATNALTTPMVLQRAAELAVIRHRHYLRPGELDAIAWLKQHARPDDVLLANEISGNQIAQRVSIRVALGHWALTPNAKRLERETKRLLRGAMAEGKAVEFIDRINARFIYVPNTHSPPPWGGLGRLPGVRLVYSNADAQIYAVDRDKGEQFDGSERT